MIQPMAPGEASNLPVLHFEKSLAIWFLKIAFLVNLICLPALFFTELETFSAENSLHESVQAFFLVFAAAVFLMVAIRARGVESAVAFASAAVAAVSFSREFVAPDGMPVLEFLHSHEFRYATAIPCFGLAIYRLIGDQDRLQALWRWLFRLGWWPYLLSLALLVIGEFFEKQTFMDRLLGQFIEESMELGGYVVYFLTGVVMWRQVRS